MWMEASQALLHVGRQERVVAHGQQRSLSSSSSLLSSRSSRHLLSSLSFPTLSSISYLKNDDNFFNSQNGRVSRFFFGGGGFSLP